MSPDQLALAVVHFVEDIGLMFGLGSIVVWRLSRMKPRLAWARPSMANGFLLAMAGGAGVLIFDHSWLVFVRLVAEVTAWVVCVRGIPFVAPIGVLAASLLAVTGHASHLAPPAGAELVDALHVLSAGMWAGGTFALATLQPPQGWRSQEARMLLDRFGRVAVIAFGMTALTGLLRATEQLSTLEQLWTTPYGITLIVKVAGVAVMLALGLLWRRGRPLAVTDAMVMVGVIFATALLAVFPSPA